jgi:GNAT superfamily N-acetyltransferase
VQEGGMTGSLRIRQARPADSPSVAGVLSAAASKLRDNGLALWTAAEVSEQGIAAHVRDGLYHVMCDGELPVGVFRFELRDPLFWPEIEGGTSAFVHKLAVCPGRQGEGFSGMLLRHACELARAQGLRFLRLDCAAGRPRLRAVYERFGFRHHSDKQLGSGLFHRFEYALEAP